MDSPIPSDTTCPTPSTAPPVKDEITLPKKRGRKFGWRKVHTTTTEQKVEKCLSYDTPPAHCDELTATLEASKYTDDVKRDWRKNISLDELQKNKTSLVREACRMLVRGAGIGTVYRTLGLSRDNVSLVRSVLERRGLVPTYAQTVSRRGTAILDQGFDRMQEELSRTDQKSPGLKDISIMFGIVAEKMGLVAQSPQLAVTLSINLDTLRRDLQTLPSSTIPAIDVECPSLPSVDDSATVIPPTDQDAS